MYGITRAYHHPGKTQSRRTSQALSPKISALPSSSSEALEKKEAVFSQVTQDARYYVETAKIILNHHRKICDEFYKKRDETFYSIVKDMINLTTPKKESAIIKYKKTLIDNYKRTDGQQLRFLLEALVNSPFKTKETQLLKKEIIKLKTFLFEHLPTVRVFSTKSTNKDFLIKSTTKLLESQPKYDFKFMIEFHQDLTTLTSKIEDLIKEDSRLKEPLNLLVVYRNQLSYFIETLKTTSITG